MRQENPEDKLFNKIARRLTRRIKKYIRANFNNDISQSYGLPRPVSNRTGSFQKRYMKKGMEPISKESIRIKGDDADDDHVSIDTTVQEKNITFPCDVKMHRKIISKCRQLKLRYSFKRRAVIELITGHLKTDHSLIRNFYTGIFGNNINIKLNAAAFNFRRIINIRKQIFFALF